MVLLGPGFLICVAMYLWECLSGLTLETKYGKLVLVDLAGSERVSKTGAEGQTLAEAKNINRSLSALGDVIMKLDAKAPHIPFRNSKLTYLLRDSLGRDNKALMVVQVSPALANVDETVCSPVQIYAAEFYYYF